MKPYRILVIAGSGAHARIAGEKFAKTLETAKPQAELLARNNSVTDGTAYATIQRFLPVCKQWDEVETVYATNGTIT